MKYAAINIGPIIGTFSLAKKIKELWLSSYMFSFLMECIVKAVKAQKINIISPATIDEIEKAYVCKEVGLYPDRIYLSGVKDEQQVNDIIKDAVAQFEKTTKVNDDYINVMSVVLELDSTKDPILKKLNAQLDALELFQRPTGNNSREQVLSLIQEQSNNPLYKHAIERPYNSIPTLKNIANQTNNEFTYNKYICIVQADGDGMGKLMASLKGQELHDVSLSLLNFGSEASRKIIDYGGIPIYSGGDDLLFLAPAVRIDKEENIFTLIDSIDETYKKQVGNRSGGKTTMSYGLSISYYKYPIFEAFSAARKLLFETSKNVAGKNALAWCFRKHSGTGFNVALSKSAQAEGSSIYKLFKDILPLSAKETVVSAIAHKLRAHMPMLELIRADKARLSTRLTAFYETILEEVGNEDAEYITKSRNLLEALLLQSDPQEGIEDILTNLYGMLRTAKFIQGEEDKND